MKMNKILPKVKAQLGFTMIELLIVISILGILAVAVLSAINPIEQINRGRDTGTRSDAEQLLSAIDRYYAYKGYYPWETAPTSEPIATVTQVTGRDTWSDGGTTDCGVLDKISNGSTAGQDGATVTCDGTNELKRSFVEKVIETDYNPLYIYYSGVDGASTYVCFDPRSASFNEEASERCGLAGAGLPSDLSAASDTICPDDDEDGYLVCLP